jgi:hypothetical protein
MVNVSIEAVPAWTVYQIAGVNHGLKEEYLVNLTIRPGSNDSSMQQRGIIPCCPRVEVFPVLRGKVGHPFKASQPDELRRGG